MIELRKETVLSLLTQASLKIPSYQRAYEWGGNEVGEFWEDLQAYSDSEDDALFLGTLILNRQGDQISVVDGQQRLTTIFILLIACRLRANKFQTQKGMILAHEIQRLISYIDPSTGDSLGCRLITSDSIRLIFELISDPDWGGVYPDKIGRKSVKRQVQKIKPVVDFFIKKLEVLDFDQVRRLIKTLHSTLIVRIDISNELEAFKIFERTNARGIDLEASDLLKNHLFSELGASIEDVWEKIISNSDSTFSRMLKYFYVSQNGYVQKSRLFKQLKDSYVDKELLCKDLLNFSEFYKVIRSGDSIAVKAYFELLGLNSISSYQDRLDQIYSSIEGLRLFKITQIYPLVYSVLRSCERLNINDSPSGYKKIITFFKTLESYHFINNAVCERIGSEVEKPYANYASKFHLTDNFDAVYEEFREDISSKLAPRDEFISRFREISYEKKSSYLLIVYIFDRIANHGLRTRVNIFNPSISYSRRNFNIEHWYAQKVSGSDSLVTMQDEDINNIGNLLILPFHVNSSLNNISPAKKYERLLSGQEGNIQDLIFVRQFLEKYGRLGDDWSVKHIQSRAEELAFQAYDLVWRF